MHAVKYAGSMIHFVSGFLFFLILLCFFLIYYSNEIQVEYDDDRNNHKFCNNKFQSKKNVCIMMIELLFQTWLARNKLLVLEGHGLRSTASIETKLKLQ